MNEDNQTEPRPPRISQVVADHIAAQEATQQVDELNSIASEKPIGADRINGKSNWGRRLAARIALSQQ